MTVGLNVKSLILDPCPEGYRYTSEADELPDNDYLYIYRSSFSECGSKCDSKKDCKTFKFTDVYGSNTCRLYKEIPTISMEKHFVYSKTCTKVSTEGKNLF